jgi:hypothetical protein
MTPGELSLWRAVYAASWHQPTGAPMGAVTDGDRAMWSARQAMRAVNALRGLVEGDDAAPEQARQAREVLE